MFGRLWQRRTQRRQARRQIRRLWRRTARRRMWIGTVMGLLVALLLLSACSIEVRRNPDGTLTASTTMTEESVQSEVQAALSRFALQNVQVDFQNGGIDVIAERPRVQLGVHDAIAFRIELGVYDGALTATVTDLEINGMLARNEAGEEWNQRIAERLQRAGGRRPNSQLTQVTVSDDAVTLVYEVATRQSRE